MRLDYPKSSTLPLWLALALVACACTDWNAGTSGGPWLQTYGNAAGVPAADAGAGAASGIVQWDTWKAPEVSNSQPDAKADASKDTVAVDTTAGADAVDTVDDADQADTADTLEPGDLPLVEIVDLDVSAADAADGAVASDVPYTLDGKADFAGWPELPPPPPDVAAADVVADDAAQAEAGEPDGTESDGTESDGTAPDGTAPDGTAPDATQPQDAADDAVAPDLLEPDGVLSDILPPEDLGADVAQADTGEADALLPDAGPSDGTPLDGTEFDSMLPDAGPLDSGELDAVVDISADSSQPDSSQPDSSQPDSSQPDSSLPDGAQAPDWQGYPDLPYAADADVYGGAIGSCLSMYLYQQELCGDSKPTAACINSLTADGSLFAQFQFEPLRQCQTAVCTDLCALATDKQCMESCVAKYCAAPFLACTSNGAQGPQSCADAWKCSKQYPDKLLTISAKCYSAATAAAQQQFSAVIGCVSKPQTKGCIPEVSACFSAGAAATASCSSTLTCMNSCNGDEICSFTCMGQASAPAVQLIDDIWNCSLTICTPKCAGSSDPACQDDCMKSECQSQLVQCLVN